MTDEQRLKAALRGLDPAARDDLRRLLVHDQPDRDSIAEQLLRRDTSGADAIADLIDLLSLNPEARRRAVRILGELEAAEGG